VQVRGPHPLSSLKRQAEKARTRRFLVIGDEDEEDAVAARVFTLAAASVYFVGGK
jgi:hypothetical protein